MLGNNHLEATDAIVKHKERIVSFTHPQMQFAIKCPREPPVRPSGRVETNVVSLSTVVETPQKLLPGINVIQTCLTLATITSVLLSPVLSTMLADAIQSFGNQCWIESSPFLTSAHLHVIPGPLNLDQIHHETTAFHPPYFNTKCCSSKFADQSSTVEIEPGQRFYINLAIYSQSKQPQTLPRGVVATITPMTDVHRAELFVAASDTASDMATEAVEHLEQIQLHQNLYRNTLERKNQNGNTLPNPFQSFNPSHAQKEMNIAFHYNAVSCFSQFTSLYCANHSALIDEDRDLPPLSDVSLDPFSQEYQDMVIDLFICMIVVISQLHKRLNLNRLSESTRMYLCCPAHRFVELLMSNAVLRLVMLNLNTPHHFHTLLLNLIL